MSEVQWVPVPGYSDLYEISSEGVVKSKPRVITDSNGQVVRKLNGAEVQIHTTSTHPKPYVVLHDGKRYNREVVSDLMNRAFK